MMLKKTNKKLSYRRDSARCGCTSPQPKSSPVYGLRP